MPSNVEIKANVHDVEKLNELAAALSNSVGTVIIQNDTFFNVPNCRLKLRQLEVCNVKFIEVIQSNQIFDMFIAGMNGVYSGGGYNMALFIMVLPYLSTVHHHCINSILFTHLTSWEWISQDQLNNKH